MSNDFDITEFAKMFDAALASDNPAVKKALRNFMLVSAIVFAEEDTTKDPYKIADGPLTTLIKKIDKLQQTVYELQNSLYNSTRYSGTSSPAYPTYPGWGSINGPNPGTTWLNNGISSTSGNITSSVASWSYDDTEADLASLLKEAFKNQQ